MGRAEDIYERVARHKLAEGGPDAAEVAEHNRTLEIFARSAFLQGLAAEKLLAKRELVDVLVSANLSQRTWDELCGPGKLLDFERLERELWVLIVLAGDCANWSGGPGYITSKAAFESLLLV